MRRVSRRPSTSLLSSLPGIRKKLKGLESGEPWAQAEAAAMSPHDWSEREISKIAKRKLRDFNGAVALEGIIKEVEWRFRHPVNKDYVMEVLEASNKMGVARYVLFDGMIDLRRTQEIISRQSKRLLGERAGLSLEKLTEELQAWVDSRLEPLQVLHAIRHSAKNGVRRFRVDDDGLIYLKPRESKWPPHAPPWTPCASQQLWQHVLERVRRLDTTVSARPQRRLEELSDAWPKGLGLAPSRVTWMLRTVLPCLSWVSS